MFGKRVSQDGKRVSQTLRPSPKFAPQVSEKAAITHRFKHIGEFVTERRRTSTAESRRPEKCFPNARSGPRRPESACGSVGHGPTNPRERAMPRRDASRYTTR